MKKNFNFALVGAIALVGAANFTACSSSDEIVDNPDYNPETNTVKTTISINIDPNNNVANTRQSSDVVQANQTNSFRGMQDLKLFTSSSPIVSGTTFEACLELDAISDDQISNTQSSKIYANKEVKVGTTNFLFYGKAMTGVTASSSSADKLAYGYTTTTLDKTNTKPSEITFSASSIISKTASDWTRPTTSMATYLTSIANVYGTYGGTTHKWSSATNSQLRSLYDNFTHSTAIRGGSAHAVLKTIQELYNAVYPISDGDPVTSAISTALLAAISNETYVTGSGEGTSKVFTWKDIAPTFPENIGMLEGTAQYKWDGTEFVYLVEPILNASTANDLENYVYPNELYYLTKTPLKATSGAAVWPTTVSDWKSEQWSGWDNNVSASTKNIALENNIQYGTALLATQVRCAAASVNTGEETKNVMYDNAMGNVPGATENNPIPYSDTAFPLSAVIVGGQPSEVGWDFLPTTSASFNKDVCDPNMSYNTIYAKNTSSTVFSEPNYTMVFDNLKPGDGEQQNVNICLEFTNNTGSDFYGKDGLIMNGQKFYLVALLKLSDGTQADDDAKADLKFNEARTFFPDKTLRVFIQDFVTTAQISLTSGSSTEPGALGGATPTIPDLRTSEQSLGLSVDLKWKKGLTFNVDL